MQTKIENTTASPTYLEKENLNQMIFKLNLQVPTCAEREREKETMRHTVIVNCAEPPTIYLHPELSIQSPQVSCIIFSSFPCLSTRSSTITSNTQRPRMVVVCIIVDSYMVATRKD